MSKCVVDRVARVVASALGINAEFRTRKLGNWGVVDRNAELSTDAFVFVEVECGQKHPSTNVLKVWPYLVEKKKLRVFLVQCYLPKSSALRSSRRRVAAWLGQKMEKMLKNRFFYTEVTKLQDKTQKQELIKKFKEFESLFRR